MNACGFASLSLLTSLIVTSICSAAPPNPGMQRYLYVACPGIRNYLEYGGHGLLVFNIEAGHRFVKRIPTAGLDENGKPLNVKGICANASTGRAYISTLRTLQSLDLTSGDILWERAFEGGCDRMAISPDGQVIYLPSLEKDHWHIVNALTGDVIKRIEPQPGAHNTVFGVDGSHVYLAGLRSTVLKIVDAKTQSFSGEVGPFSANIRPFTVNGRQTLCFVNVNDLLGFEIGDIKTGKMLYRVEVQGFDKGPTKRHGCPSHGIGLTPDERELWVCDAANSRMHVFDATVMPPKQLMSIEVREQPGWITFSSDGKYAYPSTGDVIDIASKTILAHLTDEHGKPVHSEKMLEIRFLMGRPFAAGDQFGVGRVIAP
ncbi:MAG: hypothetical protein B7Z55_06010 [Planctomycetales bacterium 12-60-4]|nr:MAG: hypothetical protein B7Z55_06010 [Planctomycetales bacterium 12-60-4]